MCVVCRYYTHSNSINQLIIIAHNGVVYRKESQVKTVYPWDL